MNTPSFTPEPWILNGNAIEIPDRFNTGMTVTLAHIYDERDIALDPGEIKANARLMVAAPEIYNALKALMGFLDSGDLVRNTSGDSKPGWAVASLPLLRALSAAHNVLVKAVQL